MRFPVFLQKRFKRSPFFPCWSTRSQATEQNFVWSYHSCRVKKRWMYQVFHFCCFSCHTGLWSSHSEPLSKNHWDGRRWRYSGDTAQDHEVSETAVYYDYGEALSIFICKKSFCSSDHAETDFSLCKIPGCALAIQDWGSSGCGWKVQWEVGALPGFHGASSILGSVGLKLSHIF